MRVGWRMERGSCRKSEIKEEEKQKQHQCDLAESKLDGSVV